MSHARKLIDACDDSEKIKATGQYTVSDSLSQRYFEYVADRVAEAKKRDGSMEYHVVVAPRESGESRGEDARLTAFGGLGIRDLLTMKSVEHPWPFEVLIGGHSVIIALLGGKAESKYEAAVKITDPVFSKEAAEWFRDVIWSKAKEMSPVG